MLINLIGGFAVGVLQKHMSFGDAVSKYSLLTVGDGLVAQIPALLISLSSGLIVTRAATESDLGTDLLHQFTRHKRTLQLAGGAICVVAIVPGLPKVPFLLVGGILLILAARLPSDEEILDAATQDIAADEPAPLSPDAPERIANEMRVEPLELEIAFDLVDLVDTTKGGDLLDRVRALRRKLALELGVVIPLVRTRDNLELPSSTYAIRVHGVEVGRGDAPQNHVLVLGDDQPGLPGTVDVRAGVRTSRPLGPARVPPSGRGHRRDRRRPGIGDHDASRRSRAPQRGPPPRPPGRQAADRSREADRSGRRRRAQRRRHHRG